MYVSRGSKHLLQKSVLLIEMFTFCKYAYTYIFKPVCCHPIDFMRLSGTSFLTSFRKYYLKCQNRSKSAHKCTTTIYYSYLAVHNTACMCDINQLDGCAFNTPRGQRSSCRCLGKSLQTCCVSPFVRMKRVSHAVCLESTMKRPPRWRWTPSLTWMF